MELKNKKVLVTGGSSGYGRGIAEILKNADAEVWITGRDPKKLLDCACEIGVHGIVADVTKPEDWDTVLFAMNNDIDILINNAGSGGKIAPVSEQSDLDIINCINNNLTGTLLGCRRAGAIMSKKRSGMIINVSSVCALYAWPGWSIYTAAKAGIAKFSHGLYTELRPFNVRVCCLTPSWGQTQFNAASNISGAAENPDLSSKCTSPTDLGNFVRQLIETPDYLNIVDVTIQPMIQEISPM